MDLTDRLAVERRARLAAERLLDLKSRELFEANAKLSRHALKLSDQIVEQREHVRTVEDAAAQIKGEHLQTRAQLVAAEEQVERVERRLWDSVESITDGFAVFDRDNRLIAANSAWLSIFDYAECVGPGWAYEDVLRAAAADKVFRIGDVDPADWAADMAERWAMKPVPEVTLSLWNGQFYRLVERRARDGDMVCLAQDITEIKRHEAELQEARISAEAAARAKSAFLANMSHELRTPMNGVVAMTEMLLETPLDEEQQVYLRTIKNSGEALLTIINDVLDFSKMEAGRLVLHPEPFDFERLMHELLLLVAPTVRDKSLAIHVDYDLFLPTRLVGDPGRIRQVLTNLVGNAIKFTNEGHILIRVVGVETEGNIWQIHVTVEDTGIGIDQAMQQYIFNSFAQVEDERNRNFEGTGLGLAISQQLVSLMGGEVWVESELGKGSCFGFRLALPNAEPRRAPPRALEPGQVRALIVGGSDLDCSILKRQLSQLGLETESAPDAAGALDRLGTGPKPQIVLIEQDLPDATGAALAARLRSGGFAAAIVLICTDGPKSPSAILRPEGPADAVLHRPVLRSELFRTLARLPAPEAPAPRQPAVAPQPVRAASPVTPPRRMRILAAEDNKTNRFVFGKMVRHLDIELEFACDGQEAIDRFGTFRPDLIFMDISMPRVDGKQATRAIRDSETAGSRTPIVALTAHAMAGDKEEILAAGLDRYLTKPLRKAEIVDCVVAYCPADCRPALPDPMEERTTIGA